MPVPEELVSNRWRIATAVVTLSSLGLGLLATSQAPPRLDNPSLPLVRSVPPQIDGSLVPEGSRPVDLLGNEVTPAIANYKLDPSGTLYEEHSPDTELPRLTNPKS
jgi:hypothetical protein